MKHGSSEHTHRRRNNVRLTHRTKCPHRSTLILLYTEWKCLEASDADKNHNEARGDLHNKNTQLKHQSYSNHESILSDELLKNRR